MMANRWIFLVVLLMTSGCAFGRVLAATVGCPLPPPVEDFQLGKYMGDWYEIAKFPAPDLEPYEKCIYENLRVMVNGTIAVQHNAIDTVTLQPKQINGHVVIPDPTNPAKMVFMMDNAPTGESYWVIATDYQTYALTYSCTYAIQSAGLRERCKVQSRDQTLSQDAMNEILAVMAAYNIDSSKLEQTDQTSCSIPQIRLQPAIRMTKH